MGFVAGRLPSASATAAACCFGGSIQAGGAGSRYSSSPAANLHCTGPGVAAKVGYFVACSMLRAGAGCYPVRRGWMRSGSGQVCLTKLAEEGPDRRSVLDPSSGSAES